MPISQINTNSIANGAVVAADLAAGAARANFGAGAVLQVVTVTASTDVTTTNADILSLTITPSSTSSRIFLIGNATVSSNPGSNAYGTLTLIRNSSTIMIAYSGFNSAIYTAIPMTAQIVDSPSTTSSTTYKLNISRGSGGTSTVTTSGVGYSLTAMEIAG